MSLQLVGGTLTTEGVSRLTTEHIYFPVTTSDSLTGYSTFVAFMDSVDLRPTLSDWNPSSVVNNPDDVSNQAIRILIGPELSGVDLTPITSAEKTYHVFVKIETPNESIIRRAGVLKVR